MESRKEPMAIHAEKDEHEIPCPRCGAEAAWSFVDAGKSQAEIMCPNCGRFEMSREDFDQATTENAELTELE